MTPEEKKALDALKSLPVANYASAEVWLAVAVPIIAQAIREAVAEEREACAHIASSRAIPILVENITTAGVSRELDIAVQIAAAIRARGQA